MLALKNGFLDFFFFNLETLAHPKFLSDGLVREKNGDHKAVLLLSCMTLKSSMNGEKKKKKEKNWT